MKPLNKVTALMPVLLLVSCASNEELFAEYDAYCEGAVCLSTEPEVVYREVVVEVETVAQTSPWEPAVYFGYDSSSLDSSEQLRLDRNIEVLNSDLSLKISLQAFTDSVASIAYNARLAEARRLIVLVYLQQSGITEDRIVSSAGGESLPVLPSDSVEDRIINRRVEMMLLDGTGRPVSYGISIPEEPEEFIPPFPEQKIIE